MAGNDRFEKDPGLIYHDAGERLEANNGMANRNPIVLFFYHQIWNIKAFFNTIFAHGGNKDEDTMRRADEDYEMAHERNEGEVEESTKILLAKEKEKTTAAVNKLIEERMINVESYSSDNNFAAVADALAAGSDTKKKNSFYNLVSNRIKSLNEARDRLNENIDDPKSTFDYYNELKETESCLQEYLNTHNAYGREGKNREEFVKAVLPMISGKRNAFFDEYADVINLQEDVENHTEIAKNNKIKESESVSDLIHYEESISDDEEEIIIPGREKTDDFTKELKDMEKKGGTSQIQIEENGMTEKVL